jgi:hypothetical protein
MNPAIIASIHVLTGFGLGIISTLSVLLLTWLRRCGRRKTFGTLWNVTTVETHDSIGDLHSHRRIEYREPQKED